MSNVFFRIPAKHYPTAVRGEGVWLWDETGKRYLDGSGGACVASLGHGVEAVARAAADQMAKVSSVHASHFLVEATEELARETAALCGGDEPWRAFFVSGGSEAVESAVKLARQYWREKGEPDRYKVVSRWTSYHGNSMGALALSGHTGRRRPYLPLIHHTPHIEPCYCYRCPFGKKPADCGLPCAEALERTLLYEGPDSVAAFIAEPVVGASAGTLVPPPGYWPRIREICDRYGILLIADEVMTGAGRTGRNLALHHWGVKADILTLAKGLSGGYAPLGATVCREAIYQTLARASGELVHGFTFSQHPVAMAVGVAVLRYVKENGLVERSARMGEHLLQRLRELEALPAVGDVRGLGLFASVELVADKGTKAPFDPAAKIAGKVAAAAMKRGLVTYPGSGGADGIRGDHVLVAPPFVIERGEIDFLVDTLKEALVETTGA